MMTSQYINYTIRTNTNTDLQRVQKYVPANDRFHWFHWLYRNVKLQLRVYSLVIDETQYDTSSGWNVEMT